VNRTVLIVVFGVAALVIVAGVAAAIFYASTGRIPPASQSGGDADATAPTEPHLTGSWDNKLFRGMDPATGTYHIGLSGRFIVSGVGETEQEPLKGDVTVDVYELKPLDGGTEPKLLEEWLIESASLTAFGKQEKEGFVLTLNLPWSSYRPDITAVKLSVKFKPADGAELKQEDTVTLDHSAVK
jgi:hypothetical protein